MVNTKETISHASKGFINDYYLAIPNDKKGYEIYPNFDRAQALADIRQDETVKAAIVTLTDKSLEYGYSISSLDPKSNLKSFEEVKKKVRFDKILRKSFSNLFGFNNVFIENVKDGNSKIKELHILDTTQTEPITTEHGEIVEYIQKIKNYKEGDYPSWTTDEVTHISIDDLGENIWSDIAIGSVHKYVLLKNYIYAYYGWFFGTNQKRNLLNIKESNDDGVKTLLSYIKRTENDITKHLPFSGEIEKIVLGDLNDADKALALIDKCDSNILKLMQVPSIAANETGNSNRSSGDKQEDFLITRIKSVHQVIEEAYVNDLFVKMGFPKIIIKFNNPAKTNLETVLQNAERMKTIGFSAKKVEEYLHSVNFPVEGELIDEELFKPEVKEQSSEKSEDMYPSRQRKASDESSKNIGTGEQSTTRKEQLVGHSKGFNEYPYVMEDEE